jgi:NAD(P)-dependent dehydrogenase (short-subunit alcohol dehydrogenase family)
MERLKGKISIVTGGGSGIGRGIAQLFASEGSKVVVAEIAPQGGRETVKMIQDAGGDAIFVETDVSLASDVERMVKATVQSLGTPHILVNNAGIFTVEPPLISDLDEVIWDQAMAVNLRGVYLCCKYAVSEMIKTGAGSIVNIASIAGLVKSPSFAYAASKGGVIAFTRSLALQCAPYKIRANAICPGPIDTPGRTAVMKNTANVSAQKLAQTTRLVERLGTPEDIAQTALHLASDESSYITSAVFTVDGGTLRG